MVSPTVTELPRNLEPATPDPFVQDLNELSLPRGELARTRLAATLVAAAPPR